MVTADLFSIADRYINTQLAAKHGNSIGCCGCTNRNSFKKLPVVRGILLLVSNCRARMVTFPPPPAIYRGICSLKNRAARWISSKKGQFWRFFHVFFPLYVNFALALRDFATSGEIWATPGSDEYSRARCPLDQRKSAWACITSASAKRQRSGAGCLNQGSDLQV